MTSRKVLKGTGEQVDRLELLLKTYLGLHLINGDQAGYFMGFRTINSEQRVHREYLGILAAKRRK
jgi:hypothetical protein